MVMKYDGNENYDNSGYDDIDDNNNWDSNNDRDNDSDNNDDSIHDDTSDDNDEDGDDNENYDDDKTMLKSLHKYMIEFWIIFCDCELISDVSWILLPCSYHFAIFFGI